MFARWRRIGRISRQEWLDFGRALLAVLGAEFAVKFRSRGQLLAYDAAADRAAVPSAQLVRAGELEVALSRATRFGPFRPACLARSVALHTLLRRAGIPGSRIHIGVRQEAGALTAHAWVTLADRVMGDDPRFVGRFTEIADARMAGRLA